MLEASFATALLPDSFAFARDGFVLLRGCLPESLVDRHAAAVAAYRLRCEPAARQRQAHPQVLRQRNTFHLQAAGILGLVLHERLLAPLNMLAGERAYLLGIDALESAQVLLACSACAGSVPHLSALIALRPMPLEAGLKVQPGSHLDSRRSLRRLLAGNPALAAQLQRMHEEGASLEQWRQLEMRLQRAQAREPSAGQAMRLLALRKGDVLIQQQGLLGAAGRVERNSCLMVRYGAAQLHRTPYFSEAALAGD
ncbi:hypothetical protein [Azotobacter vinelandii]|uniref:hypothetical protein n=1 Tax=Azotobacter vinelandii TaxID=354 RepID=UPI002665C1CF|nr:hypothetical protein [Azotobacter vinelandii]WKN22202.1 hypothetical protein AVAEIV_000152 [Azotobacter vinelandii]